jgi:hypothetical protein
MKETAEELETKLLAILNEPEESAQVVDAIEKTVDGQEDMLSEEQRATLQSLLEAGMPTPEEIVREAKMAEHNAVIARSRQEDLARRRERRAKRGKLGKKKHRRR